MSLFGKDKFSVKLLGRAGIVYIEGSISLAIDSEMLTGPEFDMVIYLSRVKPETLVAQGLNEGDLQRIKSNISTQMNSTKIMWD